MLLIGSVSETNSLVGSMVCCRLGRSIDVILIVDDNSVVEIVDGLAVDIVGISVICLVGSPVDATDGIILGDLVGNGDDIFVGNRDGLVLNPYNLVVSGGDSVGISSRMLGVVDEVPLSEVTWVWGKEDIVLSLMVGVVVALGVGVEDSVTRRKVFFSSFLPLDALL